MKLNLKIMVSVVVFCVVSTLNLKVILDIQRSNDFLIASLTSVGEGNPDEGSGGDNSPCGTNTTSDISFQCCRGVDMYARVTITHECHGKGLGLCQDGVEYYFYDCEGAMIKHDEYISIKECK